MTDHERHAEEVFAFFWDMVRKGECVGIDPTLQMVLLCNFDISYERAGELIVEHWQKDKLRYIDNLKTYFTQTQPPY